MLRTLGDSAVSGLQDAEPRRWTISDSAELFEVAAWGKGYFSVNAAGHICVHPG